MNQLKRLLFIVIIFSSALFSQDRNWNAVLNITPFPSPFENVWELNPGAVGNLTLFNNAQQSTSVRFRATLKKDGVGVVLTCVSDYINVPSIPTVLIDNTKIVKFSNADYPNGDLKDKIDRTGRIPQGHYTLCIDVEDPEGSKLVQNVCSGFTIVYPEPPHLVTPYNDQTIENNVKYPVFQWTPVVVPPGYQLNYSLKIVEILPGQTPQKALSSNIPVYTNDNILNTTLVYPISAFPIDTGKTYAWQVQVLDQFGYAPAQNDGKSEIFTFRKKKPTIHFFPITIKHTVELLYPADKAKVEQYTPTLQWKFKLPYNTVVKYKITIVEMDSLQTPDDAIKNNTPLYIPLVDSYTNQYKGLPLVYNKRYAWKVDAVDVNGNKILGSSDIRSFHYFEGSGNYGNWSTSTLSGKISYRFAAPGDNKPFPLANMNISLIVEYHPYDPSTKKVYYDEVPKSNVVWVNDGHPHSELVGPDDWHKKVAVTRTDANGNFTFKFIQIKKTDTAYIYSSGIYNQEAYRIFRIAVDKPGEPYYSNPSKDIIIQPGENKNAGNFTAKAKSYQLTINVVSDKTKNQKIPDGNSIPGMNVWLLRRHKPGGVPVNEGAPEYREFNQAGKNMNIWFSNYEIVAKRVSDANGDVIFTRVVKNSKPNDKYYIFSASTDESVFNYSTFLPVEYEFNPDTGSAFYENQYVYPKRNYKIKAHPIKPYVKGIVRSSASGISIQGASVKLIKYSPKIGLEKAMLTGNTGKFIFTSLDVNYKDGSPISPKRFLYVYKNGYKPSVVYVPANNKVFQPGEKWEEPIDLKPNSIIKGQVIGENGGGVPVRVTVVNGETAEYNPPFMLSLKTYKRPPINFKVGATSGKNEIIFTPLDASYFADTISVNVTGPVKDIGVHKLYKKMHRMLVYVRPGLKNSGTVRLVLPGSKIVGAKVQLLDKMENPVKGNNNKPLSGITNNDGKIEFEFTNPAQSYKIYVTAPDDQDYLGNLKPVQNSESKDPALYTVYLQKATRISGHVYVGKNNQPVAGARVRLGIKSDGSNCETNTDSSGTFILRNVPIGQNYFIAGKSSSNLIGDKKDLNVPAKGLSNIDFNLKIYNKMDITHLMGFPIEVDSLVDKNNQVFITGSIVKLDSLNNNQFQVSNNALNKNLDFTNVEIVPDKNKTSKVFGQTIPVSDPATLPVKTDMNHFSLNVLKNYSGLLKDNNIGIELDKNAPGSGVIKGKVIVSQSSFSKISSNLSIPGGGFYIRTSEDNNLRIPVITATKKDPVSNFKGFLVSDSLMHSLKYSLYDFKALADSQLSLLTSDTLWLNTKIQMDLTNAKPSRNEINLGKVDISQATGIGYIHKTNDNLSLKLDKWELQINDWNLNGYFNVTKGTLQTQLFNVPVEQLHITPTKILSSTVNLKQISIGGIIPLNLNSKLKLNYNDSTSAWFLFSSDPGSSVASFGGLPGMASGDSVHISSIYLYSSQDKVDLIPQQSSKSLKIYKVGIFDPSEIKYVPEGKHVEMTSLSFNIPGYPGTVNGVLVYYKENGKIKMRLIPFKIAFKDKGINYAFSESAKDTMIFNSKGLYVRGRLWEEGKYSLDSWLYHTVDSTSIWVETPNSPFVKTGTFWQKLQIGGNVNYFDSVGGHINVIGNNWDTLSIAGNLTTPNGINGGQNRMTFTVTGEFYANNQSVGVKNISTPFGNMAWKYDFEKGQLIGTMDIDKNMSGVYLKGPAELLVDGSGWFFFAGITAKIPGLPEQDAAIIIGDYGSMPQNVKDGFAKVSYDKNLPCGFQTSISGFLFSGKCAIPVVIPTIDISTGVANIHFGVEAGANVKLWTSFSKSGNEYGIGAIGFIDASFSMDALTCTKLSAEATLQLGFTGIYDTKPGLFSLDGCGSFSIGADIEQQGVGVDEVCTPPNISVFNKTFAMSALMHLDSNGNTKFSFKSGSCTDNSAQGCKK